MILNTCFLFSIFAITSYGAWLWWRHFQLPISQRQAYLDRHFDSPIGMVDFIATFMIWLGIPVVAIGVLSLVWQVDELDNLSADQTNVMTLTLACCQIVGCGLILLFLGIRYGWPGWIFRSDHSITQQVKLAGKTFCMVVPVVLGLQGLLSYLVEYEHGTLEQLTENFSLLTMIATWMGAVVAAPLCEELMFRGVLQSWMQRIDWRRSEQERLSEFTGGWPAPQMDDGVPNEHQSIAKRRLGWWLPVIVCSALFALIHVGQGAAPIPLFVFALGLGFLFRYTGSLLPCIVLHFMLNGFTMLWLTLQLVFETNLSN